MSEYIWTYSKTIGEQVSYKLYIPHIFNFHALVGACLRNQSLKILGQKLDLRVHPLIIRESGSGKALSYDLAERTAGLVGLDWRTRTRLTEAGLVGTISKVRGQPVSVYGDAKYADILGFTEAHVILKATSRSDTMMETLNMILDPEGVVEKRLAWGLISYKTRVSLVMSTFPSSLVYEQLQKGFLQRCFIFYERVPVEYYRGIMDWIAEHVGVDKTVDVKQSLEKVAERLGEIDRRDFKFKFSEKARDELKKASNEFDDLVRGYFEIEVLKTFLPRYFILLCKLACHHGALELRDEISVEDVLYAKQQCMASFTSLCKFVMEYYEVPRDFRRLERQLDRFRGIEKKWLYGVSFSELLRNLRPWKKEKLLRLLEVYEKRGEIEIDHENRKIEFAGER